MVQGLTDKQGAGIVDIAAIVNIISKAQYGYGTLSGAGDTKTVMIEGEPLSYANVSVAWLQNNAIPSGVSHTSGGVSVGAIQNLSLNIYNNLNLIKSSNKNNSSTEMAYFSVSNASRYQINISRISSNTDEVYFGYAWSTMADQICPKGDANLDMNVTLDDAQIALKYTLKTVELNDLQKYLVDYNGDGLLDTTDVQLIQQKALGAI